jgi:hypothetical protein
MTTHSMTTCSSCGIIKPNPKYALTSITSVGIPHEPQTMQYALAYPRLKVEIEDELTSLHHNQTWKLVPHTIDMHIS